MSVRLAAEFVIVVLGVTIALWADSWVATRGDRAEEMVRLHALQDNVTTTLEDLREERNESTGAANALRTLVLQEDLSTDELTDVLLYALLYGSSFSPELSVYDDLKNSGELALLTNRQLRRSLTNMDSRLEQLRLAQSDLASVQQLDIDAYMIDQIELRPIYAIVLGVGWSGIDNEQDFGFISDVRFQNRILLKLDVVSHLESRFKDAEAALIEVQQIIEAQLALDNR